MRIRSMGSSLAVWLLASLAVVALSPPAGAVIIDSGDGTGNTSAPPGGPGNLGDPGWDYVGVVNGLSGVYLRNGWVLTANHVTAGTLTLPGGSYSFIPSTEQRLSNGDGTFPDLKLFGITPEPALPELPIRSNTNLPSGSVIMIGNGRDRGAATDTDDPVVFPVLPLPAPQPPDPPIPGWYWGGGRNVRWGVNIVDAEWPGDPLDTVSYYTIFDYPAAQSYQTDEAQAAAGDSGGAVFAKQGNAWQLAGIMFIVGLWPGHANNSVLRQELTGIADLSFYRDQIMSITAVPEPDGVTGLVAGIVVLAALARRRR